jgi:hypothetical protein
LPHPFKKKFLQKFRKSINSFFSSLSAVNFLPLIYFFQFFEQKEVAGCYVGAVKWVMQVSKSTFLNYSLLYEPCNNQAEADSFGATNFNGSFKL